MHFICFYLCKTQSNLNQIVLSSVSRPNHELWKYLIREYIYGMINIYGFKPSKYRFPKKKEEKKKKEKHFKNQLAAELGQGCVTHSMFYPKHQPTQTSIFQYLCKNLL